LTKAIATLTDHFKAKDVWAKSQEAELKLVLGEQGISTHIAAAGPKTPTLENLTKPQMTTTVGHMVIR
jgi:hypothetical protein